MDYPFGSSRADARDCRIKAFLGKGCILGRDSLAYPLYESPQRRTDMLVSLVSLRILLDSLQGRLVMSQTAPPVYMLRFEWVVER